MMSEMFDGKEKNDGKGGEHGVMAKKRKWTTGPFAAAVL